MFDWSLVFFLYAIVSFLILLMPVILLVHRKMISQMVLENPDIEAPMGIGLTEDELEKLGEVPVEMKIEVEIEKGIQNSAEVEIPETLVDALEEALQGNAESPKDQENLHNLEVEMHISEVQEISKEMGILETQEANEMAEKKVKNLVQNETQSEAKEEEIQNLAEKEIP